ncbi:lymphocyte antigen 75-like [Tachysurus ichikawai]
MKLFVGVFFLLACCELSVGIIMEYSYHEINVNWYQAQSYCRDHHTDLVTLIAVEKFQGIEDVENQQRAGWIGLYRQDVANNIWKWSDGQPRSWLNWQIFWPLVGISARDNNCTVLFQGYLYNYPCGGTHPFYCYRNLSLVNEAKTWEEALQHCTINYTSLASLPFEEQLLGAMKEMELGQTDSVWTGLRFMNGKWFWLNGEAIGTPANTGQPNTVLLSLPECPVQPYNCGAFNTKTNVWENRDCNEKLNFLCWS